MSCSAVDSFLLFVPKLVAFQGARKSTEFVSTTDKEYGPPLPNYLRGHCIIQISDDLLMLTGGEIDSDEVHKEMYVPRIELSDLFFFFKINISFLRTNETWYFLRSNESWTPGPDIIGATYLHQCESFIDPTSNDTWLVVSKGKTYFNRKFQYLNFNQEPHEWIEGPSLPDEDNMNVYCSKLVSSGTYLHFINTCTGYIFKLECGAASVSDACQWVLQKQTLKYPRDGAVVSLIPDSLTDCS